MEKQVKRIGVLTSGGDAPGMNSAVRAVVRSAASRGIDCVGIRRGWNGLISSDFIRMDTSSVSQHRSWDCMVSRSLSMHSMAVLQAVSKPMVVEKTRRARLAGTTHYMVVVAEGAGNAMEISSQIKEEIGLDPRVTVLGHIQRGGAPSARDRETASRMGYMAVKAISENVGNCVVATQEGRMVVLEMEEALAMKKQFNMDRYDILEALTNNYRGR